MEAGREDSGLTTTLMLPLKDVPLGKEIKFYSADLGWGAFFWHIRGLYSEADNFWLQVPFCALLAWMKSDRQVSHLSFSVCMVHPLCSGCMHFLLGVGTEGRGWERPAFSAWASFALWSALLQTPVAFSHLLSSGCSSVLVGLRRPVFTVGHGMLPWSSLETTSAMGLSSTRDSCWEPHTVCSCECDQSIPRPPQLLSPCCALPLLFQAGVQTAGEL